MTHENKRIFITSYEENTIFAEKVLQEAVYDGETLVSDSYSVSLRHDFQNNELQTLLAEKTTLSDSDLISLLTTQQKPFGFDGVKF